VVAKVFQELLRSDAWFWFFAENWGFPSESEGLKAVAAAWFEGK